AGVDFAPDASAGVLPRSSRALHRLRRLPGCPALVPDGLLVTEWSTPAHGCGSRLPPEQRIDSYLRLGVAAYNKDSKTAHYAWQGGLSGEIITRFEKKGLQIVGMKMMRIPPQLAETHYEPHKGKPFYPGLVKFMTSSPVVVLALAGKDAVAIARKMMGATFGS